MWPHFLIGEWILVTGLSKILYDPLNHVRWRDEKSDTTPHLPSLWLAKLAMLWFRSYHPQSHIIHTSRIRVGSFDKLGWNNISPLLPGLWPPKMTELWFLWKIQGSWKMTIFSNVWKNLICGNVKKWNLGKIFINIK